MTRHRLILILILIAYLFLAVGFGAVNPLFESPDENMHYFAAEYIVETGQLPQAGAQPDPWMAQEAAQPPLYYLISSLIIRPFNESQAKALVWANPRAQLGDASALSNTNVFIHPSFESWPWTDYVLNSHLLRLLSAVIGLGTLLFIYGSATLIWPDNPDLQLLTVGLVAFLPQYSFLHGSISNDPLVILLSSAAVFQLLRMWFRSTTWLALFLLGLTIGLAILSKLVGLLLLVYSLIFITALIWSEENDRPWPSVVGRWLLSISLVAAVSMIISGWMLWRNWDLYGDITAAVPFIRIAGGDRGYSLSQVFRESPSLLNSTIAVFGWMNIRPANWVYLFWKSLFVIGLIGAAVQLIKQALNNRTLFKRPFHISPYSSLSRALLSLLPALLFLWVAMVYAGLLSFMFRTPAAQGRLLYPALIPLALALTYGLSIFRYRLIYIAIVTIAFSTAVYSLFIVIPDAYALPRTLAQDEIPPETNLLKVDMGQGLILEAANVETQSASPGEIVWLDLYWRADGALPTAADRHSPEYVLELFGRGDELVGKLQGYHGGGLYPAALWSSSEVVADRIGVRLDRNMNAPTRIRLNLKLTREDSSIEVGSVKIAPLIWPDLSEEITADLGGIQLVEAALGADSVRPGDNVAIDVIWQVTAPPGVDLTTFVHLGDPREQPLAQGDSPPLHGDYPTSLWAANEVIGDSYNLTIPDNLPPSRYPIYIGMYDPSTGLRRPLFVDGQQQPNNAFFVGWLKVLP